MTEHEINPFQELYVTDSADPNVFVRLFSDYPVQHAHALFQPGNVVLKGTQGSGKSMLLNLFRPRTRLAYYQAKEPFPVPKKLANFIGAGINLTRSGALDIGQLALSDDPERDIALFPLYFADFVNHNIVRDILESVLIMHENPDAFDDLINGRALKEFAVTLSREDCWFGALEGCSSINEMCERIDSRIEAYRAFHMDNSALPAKVHTTKTNIGEPIARTAGCLKATGVLSEDAPIFIRIDQVERLCRSDIVRPPLGQQYRRMINKALGTRDLRVSYRIGTRPYAWDDDLLIYGTGDKLEHIRDFRVIDLDEMLRRKEDAKTWVFPAFAEDAFARRLRNAGYRDLKGGTLVRRVFGSITPPNMEAKNYAKNSPALRILKPLPEWPKEWVSLLESLFNDDPLEGILASAWARQRGAQGERRLPVERLMPVKDRPWNRAYWRKERVRQGLMHIAARAAQRLKWSGKDRILGLSAGNISIFLSICHEIWVAFLRSERHKKPDERRDPLRSGIDPDIQAVGIYTASDYWHKKITEQPNGDDRQRFIDVLGRNFRSWLLDDAAMSYPGHNGFSLAVRDLERCPALKRFLDQAVDYGDLYDAPHTTKARDRRQRTKWYLSAVVSVVFQIPESHVKEPYYATTREVLKWASEVSVLVGSSAPSDGNSHRSEVPTTTDYLPLFDPPKDDADE